MKQINCNIIKDLLPLYADDVVCDDTAELIKEHLEHCENCRKKYESIKSEVSIPIDNSVQPLKKFKKAWKRKKIILVCFTAIITIAIICCAIFIFNHFAYQEKIAINGAIYTQVGNNTTTLPGGSTELGELERVIHRTTHNPTEDFSATNIDPKYAGCMIYQSGDNSLVIYLKDYGGFYIPFELTERVAQLEVPTPAPYPGGYYLMSIVQIVPSIYDSYDAERYDAALWNENDMVSYFGRDLTPPYIPDGLEADLENGTATVILEKDGTLVRDAFFWNYYDNHDSVLRKGFTLAASRIALPNDCIYLLDENDLIASYFGEVSVMLGQFPVPYGTYDPDTHEPSGFYYQYDPETDEPTVMYNKYVAEFELEGVKYQLITERMEYADFIKILKSVIHVDENTAAGQQPSLPDRGTPPAADGSSETNFIQGMEQDEIVPPEPPPEPNA